MDDTKKIAKIAFEQLNQEIGKLIKCYFNDGETLEKNMTQFRFELESDGKGNLVYGSIFGHVFIEDHRDLDRLYHSYKNSIPYLCAAEKEEQ